METWKSVKEEPGDNKPYQGQSDYCILDSCSTPKSEELCDVKIKSREEFYSKEFESEELCNVKIESREEFYSEEVKSEELCDVKIESREEFYSKELESEKLCNVKIKSREEKLFEKEENNNQDAWKTMSSYYPKLSIPLVRLEYSQNQEIIKYLRPLLPAITSSIKLQWKKQTTELNLNLKTESVELETLTENTLVQSPKNYHYASPWDFVSVSNTCDKNFPMKNFIKTELEDNNLTSEMIKKEYEDGTFSKFFTCQPSLPSHISNIQKTKVLKKKFTQQTLNFEVISNKHRKGENAITKTPVQLSNSNFSKHISKLQPQSSDSNPLQNRSVFCKLYNQNFGNSKEQVKSNYKGHGCNKLSDEYPASARPLEKAKRPVKNFACKVCGKPVTQLSKLRRHYATHDPTRRYECDICKKKFKMKEYLRQHIQSHNLKQYPCKYCSRLYRRKSTLRRHIKMHDTGVVKVRKYTPRTHISQLGGKNNKNEDKGTTIAPLKLYECDICGQSFEDKSSMKVHIEFLHIEIFGERANILKPGCSNSSLNKPFKCRTCCKRYTQSSHLKRHQESHLQKKSHFCELCTKNFSTKSSLSRHLFNKHNEIRSTQKRALEKIKKTSKTFICKICGKILTNSGDLRRHCATHDARKPYECDICKKQFAVKGYLYAHILTHDNWKPYPCEICDKIYRRKSSLQRHIYISHSKKKTLETQYLPKIKKEPIV